MLKKAWVHIGGFIESLSDRLLCVAGGLVFMQIPAFLVQYQQRLGGHVDELSLLIKKYKAAASDNNRSIEEYINLHLASDVKEFVSTGKIMSDNLERFTQLSNALKELAESSGVMKFISFIKHIEYDISRAALKNYVPSISLNYDSVIYGIAGIIIVMGLAWLVKKAIHKTAGSIIKRYS